VEKEQNSGQKYMILGDYSILKLNLNTFGFI